MAVWQLSNKIVRRLKIAGITLAILGFLYFLPSWLLMLPSVQRWIGTQASNELGKLLGTPVSIERVDLDGWRDLSLERVLVLDSLGRPALSASQLTAGIELERVLTSDRVRINALRFFDLGLLIDIDSISGRSNIQPIIDALSSDSKEPSKLVLDLHNILIRNASLRLLSSGQDRERISNLDLRMSQLLIAPDSINATLDELKFSTTSGFSVQDVTAQLSLRKQALSLSDIELYLPNSYADIPELKLDLSRRNLGLIERIRLRGLSLSLQDLSSLYSPLREVEGDTLRLSTEVQRLGDALSIQGLEASFADKLYMQASTSLSLDSSGLCDAFDLDIARLLLDATIAKELPRYIPNLESNKDLLDRLTALGQMSYIGHANWQRSRELTLGGVLNSALGRIQLSGGQQTIAGQQLIALNAQTSGFRLTPLLGPDFGNVRGELNADIQLPEGAEVPSGIAHLQLAQLDWQGHQYRDIDARVSGGADKPYALQLASRDNNFPLSVNGSFRLRGQELHDLQASIQAHQIALGRWVKGVDQLSIDGDLRLNSLDLDELAGSANFRLLALKVGDKELKLDNTELSLDRADGRSTLHLISPWAKVLLWGDFTPKYFVADARSTLFAQIPVLSSLAPKRAKANTRAELSAELDSIPQAIRDLVGLPLHLRDKVSLSASLDASRDSLALVLNSPEARIGQHRIEHFMLRMQEHQLSARGNAYLYGGTQLIGTQMNLAAKGNDLHFSANLGRSAEGSEHGVINISSQLSTNESKMLRSLRDLRARVAVEQSKVRIHTAFWDIAPATILYAGGLLQVEGLQLSTEGRRLAIEGGIGNWSNHNGLNVQLENINLRYILEAAGVYFDLLDTDLSGTINAQLRDEQLYATAAVRSPHFFVNKQDVGAIDLDLNFNTQDLYINLGGDVRQGHGGQSKVLGWIKPANGAGLDLQFDAQDLDLRFVGSFMDGIFSRLEGYGTGQARLHGIFEQGVTVSGNTDIKRGLVGVLALGTEYKFEHRLQLSDTRIDLEGVRLYDDEGNSGLLHGYVGHRYFDDFDIQLHGDQLHRLKVLQTTSPKIMPAYGKAYASGRASMTGSDTKLLVQVDLTSETGTDVMLDFNTISAGRDEGLMRFVRLKPDSLTHSVDSIIESTPSLSSIIDLKLKLNITPDARLAMRLGEDNNSILRGRGEGVLDINAPSSGNPEVYGTLSVREGEYMFNLQQLAMKRFTVREGGSLAFRGNPMQARLNNLNAVYALTANIADLDENLSQLTARTNIPVHCLLRLSGEVTRPEIRFGLELPGADSEVERRVRALLHTEDAITRQMLYLIALGKFYTSDTSTRTTSTTNNWTAVASSAISEQLSSILGGLSENIKLGTSIKTKTTAFEDTDIELNFSGTWLDNRLTINGNIGYHDNPYLNNQYLGEFEFEYRLNKPGSFRLKGYNRYNNMYQYLRQSLLTQGLGVLYRQRFDSLKDLFRNPRRGLRLRTDSLPSDSISPQASDSSAIESARP
ncbi:MAG: translocation/assembly module TamB domain-containing protein [Porphyromonas sp.]|nr:translocation/assembly module TamB domain-containing protein [Porphyromonas sp.]